MGWGWFAWFCFTFLMFSSMGNWRYTHLADRKHDGVAGSRACDILDERYARGEIDRQQYSQLKSDIASPARIIV